MLSFVTLVLIIVVTIYLALMYESTAMMLLVGMQAAFFVVSFFSLLYRKIRIKGAMEVPVGISEPGKENLVEIKISNRCGATVARMEALFLVKDVFRKKREKYEMNLSDIPRGDSCMIRNIEFPKAGNYGVTLKRLRIYDRTGLLYMNLKVMKTQYVHVAPDLHDVPVRLSMATKNFYGEADVYDEYSPGHDNSEMFQVRPYQKGDRLQNVHWKLTAKQDELMVKENSLPNCCPVILFLDFYEERFFSNRRKMLPYIEAVASISFSMMGAGCSHYVVWYDSMEKDIRRVRVDNEESFYNFIGLLMGIDWEKPKEDMRMRYKEKFCREPYLWALSLDRQLVLKKEEEILSRLSVKKIEKSLAQVEVLL